MIKKYFVWRELTGDGLLKPPDKCGPYYDEDDINEYEFETEDEALSSFKKFHKKHKYPPFESLVLVTIYRNEEDT